MRPKACSWKYAEKFRMFFGKAFTVVIKKQKFHVYGINFFKAFQFISFTKFQ